MTIARLGRPVIAFLLLLLPLPAACLGQPEQISVEELRSSGFVTFFQQEQYAQALEQLELLLKRYPADPLLLRYRAITLDHLGRSDEAIDLLEKLSEQQPDHAPTRYFLGLAYARAGKNEKALKEFEWTVSRDSQPYQDWSKKALDQLRSGQPGRHPRRWYLDGYTALEYDSNVLLKPADKALAAPGDQSAERFSMNLQLGWRALSERQRKLDLVYATRHSFNGDGFEELNFHAQELGAIVRRAAQLLNRLVWWTGRYDTIVGFLEDRLFVWTHRLTLSTDLGLTRRTRTAFTGRMEWSDFGQDGSNPPQTSRDGFYDQWEITHYLYNEDRSRFLWTAVGYADSRVRGSNFERRGGIARAGLHAPLTRRLQADLAVGFFFNRYPRFSSLSTLDTRRRRDADWDLYAALGYPVRPDLWGRIFYRFVAARNRNDFFEYDRHLAGVELNF